MHLDEAVGPLCLDGHAELVHQRNVLGLGQVVVAHSEVQRIAEKLLVVGAEVEHHRQRLCGVKASCNENQRRKTKKRGLKVEKVTKRRWQHRIKKNFIVIKCER